jgi:hypothetical protein
MDSVTPSTQNTAFFYILLCTALFGLAVLNWVVGSENETQHQSKLSSVGSLTADPIDCANNLLSESNLDAAFDMILVASRMMPSDFRIIDLLDRYVELAIAKNSASELALAGDLISRCDSLVYFQKLDNVSPARNQILKIRSRLDRAQLDNAQPIFDSVIETPNPFDEVSPLLAVAENHKNSISVRTTATSQIREIINRIELQIALGDLDWADSDLAIRKIETQIDSVDECCINQAYEEFQPKINAWYQGAGKLIDQANGSTMTFKENQDYEASLDEMETRGLDMLAELVPYAGAEIGTASNGVLLMQNKLAEIERSKAWLYNRRSLSVIREVETDEQASPGKKLKVLALIDENRLAPYCYRRFNQAWDNSFEELKSTQDKVTAMRLRLLKGIDEEYNN